jgi:hypothetical protein
MPKYFGQPDQAGFSTKGKKAKGHGKGREPPTPSGKGPDFKAIEEYMVKNQIANAPNFWRDVANMGLRVPNKLSQGKAKGKGKGDSHKGHSPKNTSNRDQTPPKGKSKGKGGKGGKGGAFSSKKEDRPVGGGSGQQSFYSSAYGSPPTSITVAGTPGIIATMLDANKNPQPIQFICSNSSCYQAHYKIRKHCMACGTPRDPGLEPQVYDTNVHRALLVQRAAPTINFCAPKAKPSPPKEQDQVDAVLFDIGDDSMEEELQEQAEPTPVETDEELIKGWFPPSLNKASVKLCIREEIGEVLKYKQHFDVRDLAESELSRDIEFERRRLANMELDPQAFIIEIAHAKQRIAILEDQRSSDDASTTNGGEHHTTKGRLEILLGNHITQTTHAEQAHTSTIADLESQIATLQAQMAREERIYTLKSAASEALRAELQARVDTFNGPQQKLAQLHNQQATKKIDEITQSLFSQEWMHAQGLEAVLSQEALKVIISQAMTVAQRAQNMGIRITGELDPSFLQQQQQQSQQQEQAPQQQQHMHATTNGATASMDGPTPTSFGPSSLENLPSGGFSASKSTTPYGK